MAPRDQIALTGPSLHLRVLDLEGLDEVFACVKANVDNVDFFGVAYG